MAELTSKYYRVRAHATNEEQVFDTLKDAREFCNQTMVTFNDETMVFDIVLITEMTTIYP